MHIRKILYLIPFLGCLAGYSQGAMPREVNLVLNYLKDHDYPERFNGKSFEMRPFDWQIIDIDDDGVLEVFLQTFPHYLQSPTITIFQIAKNDSVTRIVEGFAPGRLIPIAENRDNYTSPHSTELALDLHVEIADSMAHQKYARALIQSGITAVIYKKFIHSDKREGAVFADLRYLGALGKQRRCENFQFAKPNEIVAGRIKRGYYKYFVARVNDELYCYEIKGFENNLFVKKRVRILRTPSDFDGLIIEKDFIKYRTKSGEFKHLKI